MRVIIITQNDPFYLGKSIHYLINKLPAGVTVAACVLFKASPFGKRENFIQKILKTIRIFGFRFICGYAIYFIKNLFKPSYKVKSVLQSKGIPIIQLKQGVNHPDSLHQIRFYKPDLLISIAGNQIFKKDLIELAPKGCINLHTAILPKYRGLMPTFWVLCNGEKETGVSVFFVDEGIDSGPIIIQKRISISNETQRELIEKTKLLGMNAIIEAIEKIMSNTVVLLPNPDSEMTYYSFPTAKDVREFKIKGKRFF